jgi:signal transduction histidine kinase
MWSCPEKLTVYADSGTLKQLLVNLITNALKHGDRDIFLRVRVRGSAANLLIGNRVAHEVPAPADGLGIGLRLVRALAPLMRGAAVNMRRQQFFWAKLRLPLTAPLHDPASELSKKQIC